MILIQVVLGGASVLIDESTYVGVHIIWGILTFGVLVALTAVSARTMGTKSIIFRLSIAVIVDFVIQGLLGFLAFNSDEIVLVHLTNAFILAILATMLISYNRAIAPVEASAHAAATGTTNTNQK